MAFFELNTDAGLSKLNEFLANCSYIEGASRSQSDVAIFHQISSSVDAKQVPHVARWYSHIASFGVSSFEKFPGDKPTEAGEKKDAESESDSDSDFEIELSEDEEEVDLDEEHKRRIAEAKAHGEKKLAMSKSMVIFDVKPFGSETDLGELEKSVRTIEMEGLKWGASQLCEIAFGLKKLQITTVIVDSKCSTDELEEKMCAFEDLVQSVDIVAFNKL
eukprot:38984_1